jgi:uncharacterized membrane protein
MTDERMETIVGQLLRIGVIIAAAVVLAGGIWYLAANGSRPVAYREFHPNGAVLRTLGTMDKPELLIFIGLFILIATPVARVAFSLVAFLLERDRLYVGITTLVLAVLLYSIGSALF